MKAIDRPLTTSSTGHRSSLFPSSKGITNGRRSRNAPNSGVMFSAQQNRGGSNGHFLGSVVYIATGDSSAGFTRWLLIDGQQRLTTLTLLLVALRDHIAKIGWNGDESDPTAKCIDAYFLRNVQEEGAHEQKPVLRKNRQQTLKALLVGVEMPPEPSERIREMGLPHIV